MTGEIPKIGAGFNIIASSPMMPANLSTNASSSAQGSGVASSSVTSVRLSAKAQQDKVITSILDSIIKIEYDLNDANKADFFDSMRKGLEAYKSSSSPTELQKLEAQLRTLETEFSKNFLDPSEDLNMNHDLNGVERNLVQFTKNIRRLTLATRLETYYNLPTLKPSTKVQDLTIDSTNYGKDVTYPLARVVGVLDTNPIFEQSEDLYGIEHGLSKEDNIKQSAEKRLSLYDKKMPRLICSLFPIGDDGILSPREQGLAESAKLFFAIKKNFEPDAYNLSLKLANTLAEQSDHRNSKTTMILPMAAHHSEELLTTRLLPELSKQRGIDLQECSVCIFVNGNDHERISTILAEIDNFKTKDKSGLDINVIAAEPSKWGMGLKSVPTMTSLMSQFINGNFSLSDADIAGSFFDTDIVALPGENTLQKRRDLIEMGIPVFTGRFINDPEILMKQNVNYFILSKIEEVLYKSALNRKEVEDAGISDGTKQPVNFFGVMGGNGMYSMMAHMLMGGIRPYAVHEDVETSHGIIDQLAKAFNVDVKEEAERRGVFWDETQSDFIVCDGGSIIRTVDKNLPLSMQFASHDHNSDTTDFGLAPLDKSQPKLVNIERLMGDLEFVAMQIVNISLFHINYYTGHKDDNSRMSWRRETNPLFQAKIQSFEKFVNELLDALPSDIKYSSGEKPQIGIRAKFNNGDSLPDIVLSLNGEDKVINFADFKAKHA